MRIAAIDQGTTSTRCLVIADGGTWHLAASRRHTQHHPAPTWVEHDPKELLRNIRAVLKAAGPVDGIALANQGESCLAWDAQTGAPLSPVIVWQDARTAATLAALPKAASALSRTHQRPASRPLFFGQQTGLDPGKPARSRPCPRSGPLAPWHHGRLVP